MISATRGNAAEGMVLAALLKRDFDVLVPFGDGHPFDLVMHLDGTFLRIQCKRAWGRGGCLIFNSRSTDHGRGPQSYLGLADIFGVYFPSADKVYLVPLDAVGEGKACLRLEPSRNNQRNRIRMAADYEIDCWTPERLAALVPGAAAAAA